MNNLKKVGLTALAGSMVAFSAQALDMSVSGQAKITYVDEGEGSAGRTDVTGNPYGFDQAIAFNGSGETPIGTVSLMHVYNNATGAQSSSLISIDMGDAGTITLDEGVAAAGAETIKDKMPRAAGAEESWDDTDGESVGVIGTSSSGEWGYSNSIAGVNLSLSYAKNGGGMTGDDNNTDAGDDSDKSFAITTSSLMDGLNVGLGMAETDSSDSEAVINSSTVFATYAIGPVTLGAQWTDIDNPAGTADEEAMLYGIAFNINENASISYNTRDVEIGDTGSLKDQEDTGIAASYTMGNMTVSAFNNASDNVAGTSGREDEVTQVTLSFAF